MSKEIENSNMKSWSSNFFYWYYTFWSHETDMRKRNMYAQIKIIILCIKDFMYPNTKSCSS